MQSRSKQVITTPEIQSKQAKETKAFKEVSDGASSGGELMAGWIKPKKTSSSSSTGGASREGSLSCDSSEGLEDTRASRRRRLSASMLSPHERKQSARKGLSGDVRQKKRSSLRAERRRLVAAEAMVPPLDTREPFLVAGEEADEVAKADDRGSMKSTKGASNVEASRAETKMASKPADDITIGTGGLGGQITEPGGE